MCKKHGINGTLHLYFSYRNSQQNATVYQNLLFYVCMKFNMFRVTHRPSSGAQNCTSSLWFCICERLLDVEVAGHCPCWTSYKHRIINFASCCILLAISVRIILWCTDPWTSNAFVLLPEKRGHTNSKCTTGMILLEGIWQVWQYCIYPYMLNLKTAWWCIVL